MGTVQDLRMPSTEGSEADDETPETPSAVALPFSTPKRMV